MMETTGDPTDTLPPAVYARRCVEAAVLRRAAPESPDGAFFRRRAGCFVSIKRFGDLRGCIGTLAPVEADLADEIVRNAIAAAFHDPRFGPIQPRELAELSYSVDVLAASEPCSESDLDPRVYGVIVSSGARRGVLLPDLAGVETVVQQVTIALQKAGIRPDDPFSLERFRIERYPEVRGPSHGE